MMKIIGITGLPGSGKGELVKVAREMKLSVISMGDQLKREAMKHGIMEKDIMNFAYEIRKKYGSHIVAKLVIESALNQGLDMFVVDGLRSIEELNYFKSFSNIKLIAVLSPPLVRFERLKARGRQDDPRNLEEFFKRDEKEISLGICRLILYADHFLLNDSTLEDFREKCKIKLKEVIKELG